MIRFAIPQDHPQLKALWADAFSDPSDVVDAYFTKRHADENMLVDIHAGQVTGMLSMLPVTLSTETGKAYKARYIYAVATHRDFRRQGISTTLLEAAHAHMQTLGEDAGVLVPASGALFAFYKKRGYDSVFDLDILTISANTLPPVPPQGTCSTCTAAEYTRLRDTVFQDSSLYARWKEDEVAFALQSLSQPCGVTSLFWAGGYGCAAWEQTEEGVLVREIALEKGDALTAVSVLHTALHAEQYTLRLRHGQIPGAVQTPFGMIHWLIPAPKLTGKPPYLSLAMD